MNPTTLSKTSAVSLAHLSQPHGYRFDGDSVHLRARISVLDRAAYQHTWALQLWACPTAPASALDLAGQMVAEVALPPMSEVADEIEHLDMSAFACPPAGSAEYFMVLVLAAGRPGRFDKVHDVAVYPCRQQFIQPCMGAGVGYRIDGNRVNLSVQQIENPREAANYSGTLTLELWALAAPYSGGAFQGVHLAGVSIGSLFGQTGSSSNSFDLPFFTPPAGDWNFVLMLREWTAAGYVTRDFTNFSAPVTYGRTSEKTPEKAAVSAPAKTVPAKPAEAAQPARLTLDKTAVPAPTKAIPAKLAEPVHVVSLSDVVVNPASKATSDRRKTSATKATRKAK